jgi:hypothetical protein
MSRRAAEPWEQSTSPVIARTAPVPRARAGPIDDRRVRGHTSVVKPRRVVGAHASPRRSSLGLRLGLCATLWHVAAQRKNTRSVPRSVPLAGTSSDGETRTRTGGTTIFRESQYDLLDHERPANQAIPARMTPARCQRFRAVCRAFGTSSGLRSPKGLAAERSRAWSGRAPVDSRRRSGDDHAWEQT